MCLVTGLAQVGTRVRTCRAAAASKFPETKTHTCNRHPCKDHFDEISHIMSHQARTMIEVRPEEGRLGSKPQAVNFAELCQPRLLLHLISSKELPLGSSPAAG